MSIKYFFKTLTLLVLLQFSSNILSVDLFGPQGFQDVIAKYKAGDLEVIPGLLKNMSEVKVAHRKQAILGFLGIKNDEADRDEVFTKAQSDLKEGYLKDLLRDTANMPRELSDIVSGYLKEFKLIATIQAYEIPDEILMGPSVTSLVKLDNDKLISGGNRGIKIWDLKTKHMITSFANEYSIASLLNLGNDKLASLDHGLVGGVRIWNLKTYQPITTLDRRIVSLAKLDEDRLAVGGSDGIKIWDLKRYEIIATFGSGPIYQLVRLDDDKLVSRSSKGDVRVWDLKTYQPIAPSSNVAINVGASLLEKLDENRFATGGPDGINKWDLKAKQPVVKVGVGHVFSLEKLDENRLIAGYEDGSIKIWNLNTNTIEKTINSNQKAVVSLVKLSDDSFASGGRDGTIKIWKEELDIAA